MAAIINITRLTSTAPTACNIESACTRLSTDDDPAPGTSNPIPVPTSGSNYTFWANTQLSACAGADNSLANVKFYTDGSNSFGTGTSALVSTACTYIQATGTTGSSGDHLTIGNYSTLATGGTSDLFLYTSGCKLSVPGSITTGTGSFGDRVIFQVSVDTTASAGNSAEETLTFEFDEA